VHNDLAAPACETDIRPAAARPLAVPQNVASGDLSETQPYRVLHPGDCADA